MTYTIKCGWCGVIIKPGDPTKEVSHGVCVSCHAKIVEDLRLRKAGVIKLIDPAKITLEEMSI